MKHIRLFFEFLDHLRWGYVQGFLEKGAGDHADYHKACKKDVEGKVESFEKGGDQGDEEG